MARSDQAQKDPWDEIPVLVHTGLQKTGTSWLTAKYFRRFPDHFTAHSDPGAINPHLITPHDKNFDPAAVRAALRPVAEEAAAKGTCAVIVSVFVSESAPDHCAILPSNLRRVKESFPQAKILVTVREQKSILLSAYSELVRDGITDNLSDFLAQPPKDAPFAPVMDFDFFDYDYMYDLYAGIFGAENLAFVPQEWILRAPDDALAYMAERLGWDWPDFETDSLEQRVRPSLSWPALFVARHANRFFAPQMRWQRQPKLTPMKLAYWVDRITPRGLNAKLAARAKARVDAGVGDYFAASNRRLGEKIGVDLGAFGYF